MKTFTKFAMISILALGLIQIVNGQAGFKITVVHNGISTFFPNINAAIAAAYAKDTIYLPGGAILFTGGISLSKRLIIVGVGHYPDSTTATTTTRINTSINIFPGADSGSISGCYLESVAFGAHDQSAIVNNFRIERCKINALTFTADYATIGNPQNTIIRENVIVSAVGGTAFLTVFEKNIFYLDMGYNVMATFLNNIFYVSSNFTTGASGSIFNNNIIITNSSATISLGTYNVYNNNLFCSTSTIMGFVTCGSTNTCTNNIYYQLAVNTFVNATTTNFSYSNNYRLKSTSPGKNAGGDGTDVGIFGTPFPYKDGAVPFNPHISSQTIGTVLSPTGNLSIDIKVSAQDR